MPVATAGLKQICVLGEYDSPKLERAGRVIIDLACRSYTCSLVNVGSLGRNRGGGGGGGGGDGGDGGGESPCVASRAIKMQTSNVEGDLSHAHAKMLRFPSCRRGRCGRVGGGTVWFDHFGI